MIGTTFVNGGTVEGHISLEDEDTIVIAIDFHGDWRAVSNMPADGGCFDSIRLEGDFAASSVTIIDE